MCFPHCSLEEVTIPEFLSSMQDLVSSNLNLFSEEDEKKGKKGKVIASIPSPFPRRVFNIHLSASFDAKMSEVIFA